MNKLKLAMGLVVISAMASVPLYFMKENQKTELVKSSSDAERYDHHLKVNTDSWKGYKVICGNVIKNMLRQKRIRLECVDDKANYADRMKAIKNGDSQFAVLEVGSYVIEGEPFDYPLSIIMGIDTSFQGDALIANKNNIPNIDSLRDNPNTKVALTMKSPSEMFAKIATTHFDLDVFRDTNNLIESDGSKDAMMMLLKGEVPAAVLWEPYRSIALKDPNMVEIISTKDAQDTIVDALGVSRKFGEENPAIVKTVLVAYFKALKYYKDNPSELIKEIKSDADTKGMTDKDIKKMVAGIHWMNLTENCEKWFACDATNFSANMEIIDTANMTLGVWQSFGDITGNPFPSKDVYNIVNGEYISDLYMNGLGDSDDKSVIVNSLEKEFSSWTEKDWNNAKEFGKLKNKSVTFSKNSQLRMSSKDSIDEIASKLKHYPNFRIRIGGHTGTLGDKDKKLSISKERAEWVKRFLQVTYNIDEDRIQAVGYGGKNPLNLKMGETEYSKGYQSRLSRVDVYLIQETY
jgi:outer membrane protein OmpA-like peptidoglycan-associated protein/ABC-type taurine transport system substrate-binding protein